MASTYPRSAAVLLLIVSLGTGIGHADTTQQNLAKYHALRQRLVTEFTVVGPDPGMSLPVPERMDDVHHMKWGDGTIALGFYIGVLATEHYMLTNQFRFPGADGGDATQLERTRDELYYALLAFDRLDRSADAAFPPPCTTTPALNGFFLRDDVPANFHTHFAGINTLESDFIDPTLTNKEESHDQVYHLQHGLALVVALVPPSLVVHGRPIRAWAIEQADRMLRHFAKNDWIIRNPACSNRAVNRGANASGYSYGESLAAAFVTAGGFTPTVPAIFSTLWSSLRNPSNPTYNDEDNLHMALAIMAVGDGYGADTAQVMATLAETQEWPLYPLLHRVLHPENAGFCTTAAMVNARARSQLDELPAGGEPACPGPTGPAVHGFTTHNRYIRGKSQAYVGPTGCEGIRYHGLDYMLLHNLYAIATPLTWNGSPDADPCAILVDGPAAGTDAGINGDGGNNPNGDAGNDPGGCCDAGHRGAPTSALCALAFVLVWTRRRSVATRRRPRRTRTAARSSW